MSELEIAKIDLVIANKILARCGAVDAYGHVALRHPTDPSRFLLSRSRSPEMVERDDIMQFKMDGSVADADNRPPYLERFIYAGIFAARPDVQVAVHGHPRPILPFTVSPVQLRPIWMSSNEIFKAANGTIQPIPSWDIRDKFGDTNILIVNLEHGKDLAARLGDNKVVLLRGHGFVGVSRSIMALIRQSKALLDNAQMQLEAMRLGPVMELTPGEIVARDRELGNDAAPATMRGWEYEATQAGCRALLEERAALVKDAAATR